MALTPEYLSASGYIILLFKYQNQLEGRSKIPCSSVEGIAARYT